MAGIDLWTIIFLLVGVGLGYYVPRFLHLTGNNPTA